MKFLAIVSLLFIAYISYVTLMVDETVVPLDDEDLKVVLKSKSSEGKKLKKSFDRILTKTEKKKNLPPPVDDHISHVDGTETVKPKSAPIENLAPQEIHDQFKQLWDKNLQTGMEYLRSAFFSDKVSVEAKEELIEYLHQSDFPKEEFVYFSREVLARTNNPLFFKKVLYLHSENISVERRAFLVKELMDRAENPEIREVIQEFSAQPPPPKRGNTSEY